MRLSWARAPVQPRGRLTGRAGRWTRLLGLFVLLAGLYAAGAELSWHLSGVAAGLSPSGAQGSWQSFSPAVGFAFFPSAGLTVAAMLLTKRARWPMIVAAILAAELLVDTRHGMGVLAAAGLAGANSVEPLVGASLVRAWCGGAPDLRRRDDLARFVAGACVLGPLVGGMLGSAVGVAYAGIWWPGGVLRWWAGDGLGVLVVAAPVLLWPQQGHLIRARRVETALLVVLSVALVVAAFLTRVPPSMLLLPLLAWAAFRFEVFGAAMAGAVLAFGASYLTARGLGAFAAVPWPAPARQAVTQAFIAVIVLVALLIGQEAAGRVAAINQREAEQRERARLQSLARLGELLAAALTPEEIGDAAAAQVRHDAGAQALTLGLISADGRTLQWVHMAGYPASVATYFAGGLAMTESIAAVDAVRGGMPVLFRSAAEYEQRYPHNAQWLSEGGAASMGVWPLTAGERPIGVLGLMWTRPQPLDAAQRAYASAVATMVSQALIRARIYADEHARAAVLQAAVLPSRPAGIAGLDVAVCYQPADAAHGLGGDWWDVMPLPNNRTYLVVGDVVGHGLPAVEDMAQLRAGGRVLAMQGLTPAQLLTQLNIFTGQASHGRFATMSVAMFEHAAGVLRYGSAGHPPPLLRSSRTGEVIRLNGGRGPVLGPLRKAEYAQDRVNIVAGDILVLYTDGLIDRPGQDLEDAMTEAQQQIAGWQADTGLHEACHRLTATVAPPPRKDDVCVIAIRVL